MTDAIIFGFRLLAASQIVLTMLLIGRAELPGRTRVFATALLVGVLAYLMIPLAVVYLPPALLNLLELLANLVPALLLLLVWDMFEDEPRPTPWLVVGLVGYAGFVAFHLVLADGTPRWYLWLGQLFKVCLISASLWLTWRGRGSDLLETRLQFRSYFCGVVGLVAGAIVIAEAVSGFDVHAVIELLGMFAISMLALFANFRFQSFRMVLPGEHQQAAVATEADPLVERLTELMEQRRLYSDCELKVGSLAQAAGYPEHQVRKAINGSMGYRNFNQYINAYRIRDAALRLRTDMRSPVLTIALDVGFRSISAFNAAFRQIEECTPTQYRERAPRTATEKSHKEKLPDS